MSHPRHRRARGPGSACSCSDRATRRCGIPAPRRARSGPGTGRARSARTASRPVDRWSGRRPKPRPAMTSARQPSIASSCPSGALRRERGGAPTVSSLRPRPGPRTRSHEAIREKHFVEDKTQDEGLTIASGAVEGLVQSRRGARLLKSRAPSRRGTRARLVAALLLFAAPAARAQLALHDCGLSGVRGRCGTLQVPENPQAPNGRQLSLNVIVIPRAGSAPAREPLFVLKGGPGQAATADTEDIIEMFGAVRGEHDLVLLDQRGTGGSSRLDCEVADRSFLIPKDPKACLARLSARADLRMYSTARFVEDSGGDPFRPGLRADQPVWWLVRHARGGLTTPGATLSGFGRWCSSPRPRHRCRCWTASRRTASAR